MSRPLRWVLGAAGGVLAAGGALHPAVAPAAARQMADVASNPLWAPEHWAITFAQAAAWAALAAVASEVAPRHRSPPFRAGLFAFLLGLALGVVGTLVAATGVKTAAASGDVALYEAVAGIDLALGWACLLLTTAGAALVAAALGRSASHGRATYAALAGACALLFVATLATGPTDWRTHHVLLRGGAVALGLVLVALALGWPRIRATLPP